MGLALLPRSARLPIPERVNVLRTAERIRRHVYAAVRCGSTARPPIAAYLSALKDVAPEPHLFMGRSNASQHVVEGAVNSTV
jgi:hypothetical protein